MIAFNEPDRREEIIGIFRKMLTDMVTRLPRVDRCDGQTAGMLMSVLLDINAYELLPEIKAVFDTDCVDLSAVGDYEVVKSELTPDCRPKGDHYTKQSDIYATNRWLKSFAPAGESEK